MIKKEKVDYHIEIDRISEDSLTVNTFDKKQKIRKKRIFINHNLDERINDTISKYFKLIEIIDYRNSSNVIYNYDKKQHYMYIESKKTMPNNVHKK